MQNITIMNGFNLLLAYSLHLIWAYELFHKINCKVLLRFLLAMGIPKLF